MATYVRVSQFAVKDVFDAKYRTRAIAVMQKAVDKAIQGKVTADAPKDRNTKG
jgi:hypothetical protein